MTDLNNIPEPKHPVIRALKKIAEENGFTHLVLFAMTPDRMQHIGSWGTTAQADQEAAQIGNNLKDALGWDPKYHSAPGKIWDMKTNTSAKNGDE
jgi:hypothetical protein